MNDIQVNPEIKEKARKKTKFLCSIQGSKLLKEYLKTYLSNEFSEDIIRLILNNIDVSISQRNISRNEAIKICEQNKIKLLSEITFASLNKNNNFYWANPNKKVLTANWWLLLNDSEKYKLHIINVPPKKIKESQLTFRGDTPEKIDLQIKYEDKTFEDSRSKFEFKDYYIKTIMYNELFE